MSSRELNGCMEALKTDRAVEELRRGRAIELIDGSKGWVIAAVETLEPSLLKQLKSLYNDKIKLLITAQRAEAAGLSKNSDAPVEIEFKNDLDLEDIRSLAGLRPIISQEKILKIKSSQKLNSTTAAFQLAKIARLLPALLSMPSKEIFDSNVISINISDIDNSQSTCHNLKLISKARVPLIETESCEMVLFRQQRGFGEHLAIIIGSLDSQPIIPVRLHSACLTGDLLGSLRCDCGDQLKSAVSNIASFGSGVLLYLDQEGRGIGLANKLRAYALQDMGLDTLDADQHLGFLPDERTYEVAASMLKGLGINKINLLTNNPSKINALKEYGIDVVGRLPLVAPVNSHNQRYLKAKLDKAGHLAE